MTNKDYLSLVQDFQNGNQKVFNKIWINAKGLVNLSKYYDPSGARDRSDFEAIAMRGLLKGQKSFNPDKGGKIISWMYNMMAQELNREVDTITRELSTLSMEVRDGGEEGITFEERYFKEIKNSGIRYKGFNDNDEAFKFLIKELEKKLSKKYYKVRLAFKMKLETEDIPFIEIAKKLKVSPSKVNWYFTEIYEEWVKVRNENPMVLV